MNQKNLGLYHMYASWTTNLAGQLDKPCADFMIDESAIEYKTVKESCSSLDIVIAIS